MTEKDFSCAGTKKKRVGNWYWHLVTRCAHNVMGGRAANGGASAEVVCVPGFPVFVHRTQGIHFGPAPEPEAMLCGIIPTWRFKRAVGCGLYWLPINHHTKLVAECAGQTNAGRESSKPSAPLQPDAADEMWFDIR